MSERVVYCPACSGRYDVPRSVLDGASVVLLCGRCGHAAKVEAFEQPPAHAAAQDALAEARRPRVVVGHEVPAAARGVVQTLRDAGYAPVVVRRGEQVLAACDPAMPERPIAVILDVAIPGVLAFEVIEQLRAHPATRALPIVLLASVFERTRYKRRATNLYGADAYLELHHVPDRLGALVDALLKRETAPDERLQAPVERARAASMRGSHAAGDVDDERTYARRLLADVVLYHGDEVADGVRRGAPFSSVPSAISTAREMFAAASQRHVLFEEELAALAQRLLERDAIRHAARGAGDG